MVKRIFDVVGSLIALAVASPVLICVGLLIKLTSSGPILFVQLRVGRGMVPFSILKFRTMVPDAPTMGRLITVGEDARITRIGRYLRKTKLDELPQLINVFKGDMSFVGPRPEIIKYVEMFQDDYKEILQVRPGITDFASIKFRDGAALLGATDDPECEYVEQIVPEKIRLAKEYVRTHSIRLDLKIIALTLWTLVADQLLRRSHKPAEKPLF